MKSCNILFSGNGIIISAAVDTPEGEIKWGKPLHMMKGDAGALEIGSAVMENLNSPINSILSPEEVLKEAGFSSWAEFSKNNMLVTAELKGDKIIVHPYYSGVDGDYYNVLNRDKESGTGPYELGHNVIKALEYCV